MHKLDMLGKIGNVISTLIAAPLDRLHLETPMILAKTRLILIRIRTITSNHCATITILHDQSMAAVIAAIGESRVISLLAHNFLLDHLFCENKMIFQI